MRFPIKKISDPFLGFRQPISDIIELNEALQSNKKEAKELLNFYGTKTIDQALNLIKKKGGAFNWDKNSKEVSRMLNLAFEEKNVPSILVLAFCEMIKIEKQIFNGTIPQRSSKNNYLERVKTQIKATKELHEALEEFTKFAHPDHERNYDYFFTLSSSESQKLRFENQYEESLIWLQRLKAHLKHRIDFFQSKKFTVPKSESVSSKTYYKVVLNICSSFVKIENPTFKKSLIYDLVTSVLFCAYSSKQTEKFDIETLKKRLKTYKI